MEGNIARGPLRRPNLDQIENALKNSGEITKKVCMRKLMNNEVSEARVVC